MDDPEYLAVLKKFDMVTVYLGPADLAKTLRKELDQVGKIVQKVGLEKK
jgi:tripartite-type tricarboxylate transporter receptor subunit TctC